MNGDPAKIYDGNPQDTTTSIMGVDLTPKPPARRWDFVQLKILNDIIISILSYVSTFKIFLLININN